MRRITVQNDLAGRPLKDIYQQAADRDIPVTRAERAVLDQATGGGAHQGVIAYPAAVSYASFDDILAQAASASAPATTATSGHWAPFLLVCDGINDPGNLGALIRSAEGAGCHGVIVPERRSAGLTGVVAKTSAGAVAHIPVAQVTNLPRALGDLKKAGYWIVGATMDGERTLWEQDLRGPIAVVVGGEGRGLSRLVAEGCDFLVRIPMYGKVQSLNASVAGALLMYEVVRQRTVDKAAVMLQTKE